MCLCVMRLCAMWANPVHGPINDRALQRFTFFCKKTIFDRKNPEATGQDSLLKAASFYLSCPWSARRPLIIAGRLDRITGPLSLTAPVIIECRRPDGSKIPTDLIRARCWRMATAPALTRPCRRSGMNNVPKYTVFTVGHSFHIIHPA